MRDRRLTQHFLRFRAQGDTRALGELFDALSPELLRVARHVARDEAEAEDLVQATFLTAMERAERFDAGGRVTAWMVGILTKEARAWGRGAARRPDPERVLAEPRAREERERPEQVALDRESRSVLEAALERLPATYREVLAAHLLRRQSPQEIAAERDSSAGTVRVQLHRGLAQLRPLLPAGLSGGLVMTLAPRGSAALRTELLTTASRSTPLAASATTGTAVTTLGGLMMLQRLGLGALVALVLVGMWRLPAWWEARDAQATETAVLEPDGLRVGDQHGTAAAPRDTQRAPVVDEGGTAQSAIRTILPRLRVRTKWADGTPAPHVGFQYSAGDEFSAVPRTARTDQDGIALIDVPRAATYDVYGDRSGNAFAVVTSLTSNGDGWNEEVVDALRTELAATADLILDEGVDVAGRVLDAEGRPVAGADVWVSTGLNRATGSILATTDESGAYRPRQLAGNCLFGARADGHAPSEPQHVQWWTERGGDARTLQIDLRLRGPGARVHGVVRDPHGEAVAGARVRVGAQDGFDSIGATGAEGPPPPVEVRTDDAGRFAVDAVAPGVVDVACFADGYPVFVRAVTVGAREDAAADVTLQDGAWVYGTLQALVNDDGSRPWVEVRAREVSLYRGTSRSSFPMPRVAPDEAGNYRLGPLAPGRVELSVRAGRGDRTDRIAFDLAPREKRAWNPQLADLPVLRGIATDEHGAPLAQWTVLAEASAYPGPAPRAVFTGRDGRFEVVFDRPGLVDLVLNAPDTSAPDDRRWNARRIPHAALEGVAADAQDVQLVADSRRAPDATLRVPLTMADGSPTPAIVARLTHERWGLLIEERLPPGTAELSWNGLPAGGVRLRLAGDGIEPLRVGDLELRRGAELAVEPIRLEPSTR